MAQYVCLVTATMGNKIYYLILQTFQISISSYEIILQEDTLFDVSNLVF